MDGLSDIKRQTTDGWTNGQSRDRSDYIRPLHIKRGPKLHNSCGFPKGKNMEPS